MLTTKCEKSAIKISRNEKTEKTSNKKTRKNSRKVSKKKHVFLEAEINKEKEEKNFKVYGRNGAENTGTS